MPDWGEGERIAKHLARAGLCSRREAERMIAAGRVAVDGRTLDTPAFLVGAKNAITVDGKPLGGAKTTRRHGQRRLEGKRPGANQFIIGGIALVAGEAEPA